MGIHSGPVNEITDLNEQANIADAGINMAQQVMDCGDVGHILLSKRVADDFEQYPQWRPYLHEFGECEVKHGVRIHAPYGRAAQPGSAKEIQECSEYYSRKRTKSLVGMLTIVLLIDPRFQELLAKKTQIGPNK